MSPIVKESDNFPKTTIPNYIYAAIIAFIVVLVTGIMALIAAVSGTIGR